MKNSILFFKKYILRWSIAFAVIFMGLAGFIWFDRVHNKSVVKELVFHYAALPKWTKIPNENLMVHKKILEVKKPPVPLNLNNTLVWGKAVIKDKPKISIILTHMGSINEPWDMINSLIPLETTLAFNDAVASLALIKIVRASGYECLGMIPMESVQYPLQDPGYNTLLTGLSSIENKTRLVSHIDKVEGLMGVTTLFGSRFMASRQELLPILLILKEKNLAFIDLSSTPRSVMNPLCKKHKLFCATAINELDAVATPEAIDMAFDHLVQQAQENKWVIGFAKATPYVISKLKVWQAKLNSATVEVVPLSIILKALKTP